MRFVALLMFLIMSVNVKAEKCPEVPKGLAEAILNHIKIIRAYEYCEARETKTYESISIVIYTAEGECGADATHETGSCSVNWVRYMLGAYKGKILGPIAIGGKGDLTDKSVEISESEIEIKGLVLGKHDPLCCPTVPASKIYSYSENGFKENSP